jgi:prevent-host-death family protein
MNKNKIINVNQLQAKASQVIKDVQDGEIYEVMRYSEPAAVIIPFSKYEELKGGCRHCVDEIKNIIKSHH